MRSALSMRARLALWHTGALTLIVCVFSAVILFLGEVSLFAGLDRQLCRVLTTVDWVYHHEPDEIKDPVSESGWAFQLFRATQRPLMRRVSPMRT